VLLALLCVAGFLLGQWQNRARNEGAADPPTRLARSVVSPVAVPLNGLANGLGEFVVGLANARRLERENQSLRGRVDELEAQREGVELLEREIAELRTLQSYGPVPGRRRIPANIIGYFPYENLVLLNVGSRQGVEVGAPIIAAGGLLGTVQTVEPNRCQVMLLSNPNLMIGVIDSSRNPPSDGLFRNLVVTFQNPQAPVEVGDLIVTAGYSERIPRGIIIGRVINVEDSLELGTRRAWVDPTVSLGNVSNVQVLQ
jgi:rod shape-determining protein MreC